MPDSLDGKVAIVTGGGSGIGEALSMELARRGTRVIVADINCGDAGRVAAAVGDSGGLATASTIDVSREQDVVSLVEETAATYGRLDYQFNNAGIAIGGDARDLTTDHWRCAVRPVRRRIRVWSAWRTATRPAHGTIRNPRPRRCPPRRR
jgi:NAD(P)-dependent dehydrogenase (short-subunit alcohol dehydrogenase family)